MKHVNRITVARADVWGDLWDSWEGELAGLLDRQLTQLEAYITGYKDGKG